jgi:hypothetical protein
MFAPFETIERVRTLHGKNINEILAKEPVHDLFEILGAVEVLVGSKIRQNLPTSLAERMVFAFTWLAREVSNGGFYQYFFNSAGDFWPDVFNGLVLIKDEEGLQQFRDILTLFPHSIPETDRYRRQAQLSSIEEQNGDLIWNLTEEASQKYARNPFPNWNLLFKYVKEHSSDFTLEGA